jgi:hypothetical protein
VDPDGSVKLVCFWSTLVRLARAEARAGQFGTLEEYAEAKSAHYEYAQLCLRADEVIFRIH